MLMGLVAHNGATDSIGAMLYYLVAYSAMTIGAFTVLSAVGPDADALDDLRGLGKRSPLLTACMTIIFLGLAGLPPALAGLMGKVYLFAVTLSQEFYGLAIIAALNSALSCAYYLRVPGAMLFQKPESESRISVSAGTAAALILCASAVVLLGAFPQGVLNTVNSAAQVLLVKR
jgi:NADH-quinone oxidoreductase subunit N